MPEFCIKCMENEDCALLPQVYRHSIVKSFAKNLMHTL